MADAAENRHQELILRWGKTTSFRVNWERRCHWGDTVKVTGAVKSLIRFRCLFKSWRALISFRSVFRQETRQTHRHMPQQEQIQPCSPLQALQVSSPQTTMQYSSISRWAILNLSIQNLSELTFGAVEVSVLNWPVIWPQNTEFKFIYGSCNGLICIAFDCVNMILWNMEP